MYLRPRYALAPKPLPTILPRHATLTVLRPMLVKITFAAISLLCIVWGSLITFSDSYFRYWQNIYWREKNDHQWSDKSQKMNRVGTGFGVLIFGIALLYFSLFGL